MTLTYEGNETDEKGGCLGVTLVVASMPSAHPRAIIYDYCSSACGSAASARYRLPGTIITVARSA